MTCSFDDAVGFDLDTAEPLVPAFLQASEQMAVPATQIQNGSPGGQNLQNAIILHANTNRRRFTQSKPRRK